MQRCEAARPVPGRLGYSGCDRRLKNAGVPVERRLYDGPTHECFGMGAAVDKAEEAEQYAGSRLRSAFGS